jgi:hypothetical protein
MFQGSCAPVLTIRDTPRRTGARHDLDVDPSLRDAGHGFDRTSIYLVHEKGEILSRLDTCSSGPLWGAEGGRMVLRERVNLSSGSWFSQHKMNQLACKLALERMRAPGSELRAGASD